MTLWEHLKILVVLAILVTTTVISLYALSYTLFMGGNVWHMLFFIVTSTISTWTTIWAFLNYLAEIFFVGKLAEVLGCAVSSVFLIGITIFLLSETMDALIYKKSIIQFGAFAILTLLSTLGSIGMSCITWGAIEDRIV